MKSPVILLHGLTGTPQEMLPLGRYLNEHGYNTVLPHLPGHKDNFQELAKARAGEWLSCAEAALKCTRTEYEHPVHLIGLSMGSLLALHCAATFPGEVASVTALSPPIRLRNTSEDILLRAASFLPDVLIARLSWMRHKSPRAPDCLALPHPTAPGFPINAAIRFAQVRRRVKGRVHRITCPVLIAYDPRDHLVGPSGVLWLQNKLRSCTVQVEQVPGGEHELTLGHSYQKVYERIKEFLGGIS